MTQKQKSEITKIAQEFVSGFDDIPIGGSGWLVVDPLSAFLNLSGFDNELTQLPANDQHTQVLIINFKDGTQFIPAGSDLPHPEAKDWMWI